MFFRLGEKNSSPLCSGKGQPKNFLIILEINKFHLKLSFLYCNLTFSCHKRYLWSKLAFRKLAPEIDIFESEFEIFEWNCHFRVELRAFRVKLSFSSLYECKSNFSIRNWHFCIFFDITTRNWLVRRPDSIY